jgi:glycosyltransferase involved in cell wall biosynthesis
MPDLSVIICTHNPRPDYLRRVLDALKAQTLSASQWELLLVDNASREPLASAWDLSWHPHARHIREDELGLTPARLRGIGESRAEVLVFIDDDNVLAADYLALALELIRSHPWIGAFGGNHVGEFETNPESWWQGRMEDLSLIEVKKAAWACLAGIEGLALFTPGGAGMVIRRPAVLRWAEAADKDPLRRLLGRKGAALVGHEDTDIALFVCSLGFALGRFPQLSLTHLIPSARLEKSYRLRLEEGNALSSAILDFIWEGRLPSLVEEQPPVSRSEKLFRSYQAMRQRLRDGGNTVTFEVELASAALRGRQKAFEIIQSFQKGLPPEQPADGSHQ